MSDSRTMNIAGMILRMIFRVILLIAAVLVLRYAVRTGYTVGYSIFTAGAMASPPGEDVIVSIGEDMAEGEVGKVLEKKGLIRDGLVYRIQAKLYDYKPLPGTYKLNTSQTLPEMMERMMHAPEAETEEDGDAAGSAEPSQEAPGQDG